jgi:hypothetical protein
MAHNNTQINTNKMKKCSTMAWHADSAVKWGMFVH